MDNFIPSEKYRQILVKDGQRRFQEWHSKFLAYQTKFLQEMRRSKDKP